MLKIDEFFLFHHRYELSAYTFEQYLGSPGIIEYFPGLYPADIGGFYRDTFGLQVGKGELDIVLGNPVRKAGTFMQYRPAAEYLCGKVLLSGAELD